MAQLWNRSPRNRLGRYDRLPAEEQQSGAFTAYKKHRSPLRRIAPLIFLLLTLAVLSFQLLTHARQQTFTQTACDRIDDGYQCSPNISHYWGQYSPYFSVPSEIPVDIPERCNITFAQVLSRHGARDPTLFKTLIYKPLMDRVKRNVGSFEGKYAFLRRYEYTMGADELTAFGQHTMLNSGIKFYDRYKALAVNSAPFIRASGQSRVIMSARNWTQGLLQAKLADGHRDDSPYEIEVISERPGTNNTLSHGRCTTFEHGPFSDISSDAQAQWLEVFVRPIRSRLNSDLPGADLTGVEVIYLMDMCPFETVAAPDGKISPFCRLFTEEEWRQYDYFQSLGKYYGYGNGNPLGPTQGVGFANELIARLTGKPVQDATSTNHTLDSDQQTFPVGKEYALFADFSHDNDMTSIFSALGLYDDTAPLSNTSIQTAQQARGYSAAWTVPFGARAYFEKMDCADEDEELVRVLVNDRVIPLERCGGDRLGRCKLGAFVDSLAFARNNGRWDECFK